MENKLAVVVVGATGEMGRVITSRLAQKGYRVIAVARSEAALNDLCDTVRAEVMDADISACGADISSDSAIEAISAHMELEVAAVVHGPGVTTAGGILAAPTEAITSAVNIKVGGFVRVVRAVNPWLRRGSRLIAIGGHYGFEPTAYAATAGVANAALANVVRQYSWAYGDQGVTAHLIAPGPADTPRLRRVAESRAQSEGSSVDQVLDAMRGESAIGAFTDVGDVAWAVEMLLAPQADSLAGSTLFMDAGRRRGLP
tara:strand:- start:136305 stop:137075 length:771 start_codon:yes stop_codon:yes gene_type:complete